MAPGLSDRELIDQAGVATFLEDRDLRVAAIDADEMERWFARPPRSVFVYAERPIEVAANDVTRSIRCQRVQRWDSNVLNELAVGVRRLPMQAIAWDDAHIRYAEGGEIHEVACVPALRTVSCGGDHLPGPHGYCVDRELVVRPWRAPTVPHVGTAVPAYHDPIPDVPEGDCAVRCEPSACEEARRMSLIPRAPLYLENAPALAAFRNQTARRAFASAREEHAELVVVSAEARRKIADDDHSNESVW